MGDILYGGSRIVAFATAAGLLFVNVVGVHEVTESVVWTVVLCFVLAPITIWAAPIYLLVAHANMIPIAVLVGGLLLTMTLWALSKIVNSEEMNS